MIDGTDAVQIAIAMFPVSLVVIIIFAGYMVQIPTLAYWIRVWGPNISFLRFGFQALVRNELDNNDKLVYGRKYIEMLGFQHYSARQCAPVELVFAGVFAVALLCALKYVSFEER